MTNNSYFPDANVISEVTLEFLENKIGIKLIVFIMNIVTVIIGALAMLIMYVHGIQYNTLIFSVFSVCWLMFRKDAQKFVIKRKMSQAILQNSNPWEYDINSKCIKGKVLSYELSIKWKDVRKILFLEKLDGYLIPLTGLKNAGKFIWLPLSGFNNMHDIEEFSKLIPEKRLKIIKYTKKAS